MTAIICPSPQALQVDSGNTPALRTALLLVAYFAAVKNPESKTMHTAMSTTELFLVAMLLVFTIPYAIWRVGRTDYYAPLVVVQIITGILLGPGILGAAYPEYYQSVFTPQVIQSLNGIAWWAVMIFVWIAGIELDLRQAWKYRVESGITAGLALGTPLLFGCIAAVGMLMYDGWMGPKAQTWQFVAGVGMACAVTALPILILLMEKLHILRQPIGQRILRYASLDDIAIWGVLALILLDWERVGKQVGFLLAFGVASLYFRRFMLWLQERDRWYVGLIWLALCGLGADWSGLHFMVGAFLAGAVMDSHWFDQKQMDQLRHHVLLVVMPVFFLSTGLRTNWAMGGYAVFLAAGVLLFASVTGKLIGVHAAGKILKWQQGEASIIGWLLQTKALIMIIFANVLLDKQIITSETFTALLLMAVASTMLTVPVVSPKLAKMKEIIFRSK
jgi:Kef-type K+ transport system membrane component KefB